MCKYQIYKSWKCGSINIRSGKEKDDGAKLYSITKEVAKAGLSFCCLQETKYRNTGKKVICLDSGEQYEYIWCGMKRRREAGVGILIRADDAHISYEEPDILEPRILAINMKVYGFNLRVINVYSPTESGSDAMKDNFYRLLKKATFKKEKHQKILTLGDFNAKTSVAYKHCCFDGTQFTEDDDCNDNGQRMKNYCRDFRLGIASTFFDHPRENRNTWISPDGKTKQIKDYVLTEKFVQQYITNCMVHPNLDFNSDHRVLITELTTPKTRKARWVKRDEGKPRRINLELFKDASFRERYGQRVELELLKNKSNLVSSMDEKSTRLIKVLDNVANDMVSRGTVRKHDRQIWKNDEEFNRIIDLRQSADKSSEAYKSLTKALKNRIRFLRNERLKREALEINSMATQREIEKLYSSFQSDNSCFKESKAKQKCDPAKLKEHFMNHFRQTTTRKCPKELHEAPEFIKMLSEISVSVNVEAPTSRELYEVINRLKNGKSSNDIPAIFIKAALNSNEFLIEMTELYRKIWETLEIPMSWSHSKLVAIWKGKNKGACDDPTAYRGLQIGSSMCKILTIIIINRIKTWYESQLSDQQQGFRSGRGTTDGIFITKRLQQISRKMKKPLYLLFVDLTAAFDRIQRKWLFMSIRQRIKGSKKLVDILETLYQHTTTALAETPRDIFELMLGVRQGGPESPILYNLYMDYVMRVFKSNCAAKGIVFPKFHYSIPAGASSTKQSLSGFNECDWIGYADDVVLVFEDRRNLQRALDLLDITFENYSLRLNYSKTKTMVLNHKSEIDYPDSIAKVAGHTIDNVASFRYLGCEIKYNDSGTGDAEINLRIDCAEVKFYQLSKKFFNRRINLKLRTSILNALIRSRLVYACQTWTLTVNQLQRIKSSYMGMLRKMVRNGYQRIEGSYRFAFTNSHILKICGTTCVAEFIRLQQQSYLAHIIRMQNTSIAKRLLFNNNISKQRGPRTTLLSSVVAQQGCTREEFYKMAITRQLR